jgi:hypothetical protein
MIGISAEKFRKMERPFLFREDFAPMDRVRIS